MPTRNSSRHRRRRICHRHKPQPPQHRSRTGNHGRSHVDGTPRICELVEYHLEDVTIKGAWSGPAALHLSPHALAPVVDLPVLEVVSAIHILADLTLGLGKVVHDYLQQPGQRLREAREMSLAG